MSFNFGTVTEFDDTNTIHDPVVQAAAKAITLPRFKGVFYQEMGAPQAPVISRDFDIYSRSKSARNGVVGDGASTGWDNTATTDLAMTAGAIKGLTVGHVLKVEDEVVQVKSVDRSANTIDVKGRGLGGTTAAAHANATAFTVIGFAGLDSDLKNVESISESTLKYTNYVQTVFELLDWEKGAELARKGLAAANIVAILRQEAAYRVAEMLSLMSIHGYKQLGAAGVSWMSAGLLAQLADTASGSRPVLSYNTAGALTEAKLKAALEEVFLVGAPSQILCSFQNKQTINSFITGNSAVQVTTDVKNKIAGLDRVDYFDFEGMLLEVKVDADMPNDKIAVISPSQCRKGWLQTDTLQNIAEPAASSREKRESIQGSVGFVIEGVGYDHTYLYGIT